MYASGARTYIRLRRVLKPASHVLIYIATEEPYSFGSSDESTVYLGILYTSILVRRLTQGVLRMIRPRLRQAHPRLRYAHHRLRLKQQLLKSGD